MQYAWAKCRINSGGKIMKFRALSTLLCALGCSYQAQAAVIDYTDFSSVAGLTLNGNAAQVGNVLRVTPANYSQSGSAFSTSTVSLASNASFSTYFQFQFTDAGGSCDGQGCGADGLVFVVQTVGNNVGGMGGGIGYSGINHSLGIEFDTWNNGSGDNFSSNHIGVDVNGNTNSVVLAEVTEADMNAGDVWNAWVDYNSASQLLEARLSRSATRPVNAMLTYTIDLASTLGVTNAYVGFTSGTGAAYANHDVLSWTLENRYAPIGGGGGGNTVPEPAPLALIGLGLGLAALARRQKN